MTRTDRRNTYYSRMDECPECPARRGDRCTDDGRQRQNPHGSRVLSSGVNSEKAASQTLVPCPACGAEAGLSCRAKPYNTRMSKPHAARRKALEEARSGLPEANGEA